MSDRDAVRAILDIHALQVDGFADRGIGRYVAGFSTALGSAGRLAAALLAPELQPPAGLPGSLVEADLVQWDSRACARELTSSGGLLAYCVSAPFLHSGPDEPGTIAVVSHWAATGLPRVVVLYDLIPLRAPRHYLPTPEHEARYRARAQWVAQSDLILAISEHTRQEALELLDCPAAKVVTIGTGVSPFFSPPDGTDDNLFRYSFPSLVDRPFLLTVGGSDVRKGSDRLIRVVGRMLARGADLHLMVAGELTEDWRKQLSEAAARSGLPADRLIMPGAIADELLRACYRRAELTVMPSLAEGAGLPVLESAACGTPALASSTSALAESAATPLATFDPMDEDEMVEVIERTLQDRGRRDEIVVVQSALAAASTWGAVAERTASALDQLPSPGELGSLSRQLALVGPVPPSGGGIGVYNSRLLGSLPAGVDVDVDLVTAGPAIPDRPPQVGYVAASSFGADRRAAGYDAVVYVIGNSSGHLATVEMALRYPGWLWLHEVRLAALASTALDSLDDTGFIEGMERMLRRAYPGRAPLAAARKAHRSVLDLVNAGVGLTGPLAERCRGLLVNSQLARRLLLLDLAPLAWHPPVHVLPPACPAVRPRPSILGTAPGADLIVTFGIVSASKRPDLLVDAVALAGCRLAFVGPCLPALADVINDRARAKGCEDRVDVVGAVDDAEWQQWLEKAALAVQLRDATTGETSAAVLESLSVGVPVLTNLGSAAEWPAGTVASVDSLTDVAVASRVSELLGDRAALSALTEGGLAFAEEHSFANLASRLMSIVLEELPSRA